MKKRGKSRPKAHKPPRSRGQGVAAPIAHGRDTTSYRIFDTPRQQAAAHRRPAPAGARVATFPAYESDERRALALLLLPFLIVALSLGLSQTLKPVGRMIEIARPAPPVATPVRVATPGTIVHSPLALPAALPATLKVPERITLSTPLALPAMAPVALRVLERFVPPTSLALPRRAPEMPSAAVAIVVPPAPIMLPLQPPQRALYEAAARLAALNIPAPPLALPLAAPAIRLPLPLDTHACLPAAAKPTALSVPPASAEFGAKLAAAAEAQTRDFVIYSATYKRIAYPMGDVPSLYGACSDLIVRAYRALGIDLQDLVQRARVGSGDPNIDHRRTETLRAFFARHGEVIPPSAFGEDYKPGDIVTYYRPYSRVSRAHIAIVSDTIGPSGQPMIVHNRGWGPQIEDALFVDRITGHYRFAGAPHLLTSPGRLAAGAGREASAPAKLPLVKASSVDRTTARTGQLR